MERSSLPPHYMGKALKKRDEQLDGPRHMQATSVETEQALPVTSAVSTTAPTLQDVLQAIAASRTALEVNTLIVELGLIRDDHRRLAERGTAAEQEISATTPALALAEGCLAAIEARLKTLENTAGVAENRARRNNSREVGLPEKVEGSDMASYLDAWLRSVVAPEGLASFFALERAHREPAKSPPPGAPPRTLIAQLLHLKDQDYLLQQARLLENLMAENSRVSVFSDFSKEVQ
ncbi:hypothetical protein NDU88_005872 [Pleurodeles waltl]|uniref:Uncharacterized protein n=1 Tax=Pleurodeles waltl TaxID=8319 RepID=A0AAV7MB97_PLEWA|nr:hypothetical protein NDU88_005872 [Pleurodeles waltl]